MNESTLYLFSILTENLEYNRRTNFIFNSKTCKKCNSNIYIYRYYTQFGKWQNSLGYSVIIVNYRQRGLAR